MIKRSNFIQIFNLFALLLAMNSCLLPDDKGKVSLSLSGQDEATRGRAVGPEAKVNQIRLENDQIIIQGSQLQEVKKVKLKQPSSQTLLTILSQSSDQLILSASSKVALALNTLLSLTLEEAYASTTVEVTFNLPDSSVSESKIADGAITAVKLDSMGAGVGQVLKFNGTQWAPSDLNALTYAGNWDAATNSPNLSSGGNLGEFYIVNNSGSTDLLGGPGTHTWAIGDWVVWNNVDARWEKVDNASNVTSFNGRNGPITAQSGDYDWSMISNQAGVYFDYQPNNSSCSDGEVLKYDSSLPGWKCDSDNDTTNSGDITGVNPGTGLTGGGSSGEVTLNINVGTGANQIPQLDASALLDSSNIPNLNATKISSGVLDSARLPNASGSTDGIITATDYLNFSAKEGPLTAGTTAQYYRGDKSWQTLDTSVVPENTNLYFTEARAKAAVISPLISDGVTNLSPSEDAVFDALATKQDTLTTTSTTLQGSFQLYDSVDQSHYIEFIAPDLSTNLTYTWPSSAGSSGQVLGSDGAGNLSWTTPSSDVSSVSANSPLSSSGGTTPTLSISQANATTSGYLSSSDWNLFNNKEGALSAGTTAQYYRGDKTWQTLDTSVIPENSNLYFTNSRARSAVVRQSITNSVTNTSPSEDVVFDALATKEDNISSGTTAQYFRGDKTWQTLDSSIVAENGNLYFTDTRAQNAVVTQTITNGVTTTSPSEDVIFDALATKQDAASATSDFVNTSGDSMTGNLNLNSRSQLRLADSDSSHYMALRAPANVTTSTTLSLPDGDGSNGQVLSTDGSGNLSWTSAASGSVTAVNANSPLSSSGGTTPTLSISQSSSSTNGFLSSTDWNTFNNKENALSAGTTAQYYRGDKSWQTLNTSVVPESGNLYHTTARARSAAVADAINNGTTNIAPSQNAVFDALALKADTTTADSDYVNVSGDTMTGTLNLPANSFNVGTDQLILTSNFVGIGTASPSALLNTSSAGSGIKARFETSSATGNDAGIAIKGARTGALKGDTGYVDFNNYDDNEGTGTEYTMGRVSGGMHDDTGETGVLQFSTNDGTGLKKRMIIDKQGNVGIGTNAPNEKLDILGNIDLNDFDIKNQGNYYWGVVALSSGNYKLSDGSTGTITVPTGDNVTACNGDGMVCMRHFTGNQWAIGIEIGEGEGDFIWDPLTDTPVGGGQIFACHGVSVGDNEAVDEGGSQNIGWGDGIRSVDTDANGHCLGAAQTNCATASILSPAGSHDIYGIVCRRFY